MPGQEVAQIVAAYLLHLSVDRGLAPNTLTSYRRDLERYQHFLTAEVGLADPHLDHVTEPVIARFLTCLREGDGSYRPLSPASTGRCAAAVRGLHRYAFEAGLTTHDPAARVRLLRAEGPPQPRVISVVDVGRLLAGAGGLGPGAGALSLRDRALLEVLYATGARISQVLSVDLEDVDLPAEHLSLPAAGRQRTDRQRTDRQRAVPLGEPALRALQTYLRHGRPHLVARRADSAAVFVNARGGRLSRQSAWTILQSAGQRAGLAGPVSPHVLRHSIASHLLEQGAPVRQVQELLGHASPVTTRGYGRHEVRTPSA